MLSAADITNCTTGGPALAPGTGRSSETAPFVSKQTALAATDLLQRSLASTAPTLTWHIEDEARAPDATDAELAAVKRRIDSHQPASQRLGRGTGSRAARLARGRAPAQSRSPRSTPSLQA